MIAASASLSGNNPEITSQISYIVKGLYTLTATKGPNYEGFRRSPEVSGGLGRVGKVWEGLDKVWGELGEV